MLDKNSGSYPEALSQYLGHHTPKTLTAIGNLDILQNKTLAVFSSTKCPGNIILKTYDLLRQIRESGITVISGSFSYRARVPEYPSQGQTVRDNMPCPQH